MVAVGWVAVAGAMSPDLPVIANYGTDLHRVHVAIGKGLADAGVAEPDRTLAVSDAGAIPYYSGWRTIDYIGLNDERIAHGADPDDVVREARPTVIVATSYTDRIPEDAYGLDVPVAVAGYHQVGPFQMRDGYWQYVYVLPRWAEQVDAAVTNAVEGAQATHDPGRYQLTIDRWLSRLRGD
ncbi:hypothetical protein ACFS2C_27410 [Prauserella oleivorans]|uniref:Fe/B12 periplasmic-binding domain-containing protein n=1 Tax=Prauserella oleivorans TaxID=1478153 RepID=A0ABW5WGU8_9PSEU